MMITISKNPISRFLCWKSNISEKITSLGSAVRWAYREMYDKPDNIDTVVFHFRIIDTEENFSVSFSKKNGEIIGTQGWLDLDIDNWNWKF